MAGSLCRCICVGLIAAVLGGCDIFGLGESEQVGWLRYHNDTTVVYLPAAATVDSAFTVRFPPFGGGCMSAGRTTVDLGNRTATVTPIDKDSGASTCTAELRYLQHEALVQFSAVGAATVLVRGVEEPGGGEVELSFPIVVEQR